MKTALLLATLLLAVVAYDAAAQSSPDTSDGLSIQASFYPYYEFTRMVATESDTVAQFLPAGVAAHDWEPSISRVQSLLDADVFVYNGLGVEGYLERLTESEDLTHVVFVKAGDGLVLISTAGLDEMVLEALEEYDSGHYTAEEAIEAIKRVLDDEDIRKILETYKSGSITTAEALSSIRDLVGGDHAGHDHDAAMEADEGDHAGHDHDAAMEADEGDHAGHDHDAAESIRDILEEVRDGDTGYAEGLEAIRELVESEDHGHDEHGGHGGHDEHDHGDVDPHIWLDPVLAIQQVYNIRDGLAAANPAGAETYRANAESFAAQLEELHHDYAEGLSGCTQDTIVTTHQAFGYLVERYGINVQTLSGISPEAVSAADVVNLVEFMRDNGIEYVLAEDITDTRAVNVLAEETGAQVLTLSPLESATTAQLESGVTYVDRMRENLTVLETALSCD
jgi:zinc transport system substrate-binding protein